MPAFYSKNYCSQIIIVMSEYFYRIYTSFSFIQVYTNKNTAINTCPHLSCVKPLSEKRRKSLSKNMNKV